MKAKTKIILIFLLIVAVIISIYYISTNTDRRNRKFLETYGWEIEGKPYVNRYNSKEDIKAVLEDIEWILQENSDYEELISMLSEIEIEFNTTPAKKLETYKYSLKQKSGNNHMLAYIWKADGEIILSYVQNTEIHHRIWFWPVNYDYEQIKREIPDLKADYAK